ncbi:MAG: tetratricopeptide repeat protein, partial [Pirellulales bacterium]|nr:tetratricopeptide repeat protein [Pirellulales bacterium]
MFRPSINLAVVAATLISMATVCQAQDHFRLERPGGEAKTKSGLSALGDSLSSGFKKGMSSLAKPFEPLNAKNEPADPTRLATKARPSADLYLAVARDQEQKKLFHEAEQQYQKALKASPDHLEGMLGYGRFLNDRGRVKEAVELYHRAIKTHPDDSRPLNHL